MRYVEHMIMTTKPIIVLMSIREIALYHYVFTAHDFLFEGTTV